MTERSEIRSPGNLLLERLAWNAAAIAALAVMILVLLGSLEWLDRLGIGTPPVSARAAVAAADPAAAADAKASADSGVAADANVGSARVQCQAKAEGPRASKWP